jgi:hypothetical protein
MLQRATGMVMARSLLPAMAKLTCQVLLLYVNHPAGLLSQIMTRLLAFCSLSQMGLTKYMP